MPEMGLDETKEAIDAASKAFASWSKTTAKVCNVFALYATFVRHNQNSPYCVQHRHDVLMKFFNLMQQHNVDLGRLIVSPNNHFLTSLGAHLSLDP